MPSLRKAARGKRRWVGVEIDRSYIDEVAFLQQLDEDAGRPRLAWSSEDGRFIILEARLENYAKLIESIQSVDHAHSITSSGKIRLVKSRISKMKKSS